MEILYLLEKIRMPVLNEFMLLITQFGEETAFLVVALILFWCVNKKTGYFVLSVGFVGTLTNQFMKLWFRIPRPWVLDENFTILEQAREAATGYSFPSGHTQSAVGTFGAIAGTTSKRWVCAVAVTIAILVPFSRMYIGVHTPSDVLVAAGIAVGLIFLLRPMVFSEKKNWMPILLGAMLILAVVYMCFVSFYSFADDMDQHNLESGIESAYTLLGALIGLIIVYIVDNRWLEFPTKAIWWAQILKVVGGLLIVLVVKSGLKSPLNGIFGELPGRSIRYCLVVLVAGIVWPLTFRWFSRLGKK